MQGTIVRCKCGQRNRVPPLFPGQKAICGVQACREDLRFADFEDDEDEDLEEEDEDLDDEDEDEDDA